MQNGAKGSLPKTHTDIEVNRGGAPDQTEAYVTDQAWAQQGADKDCFCRFAQLILDVVVLLF